MEPRESDWHAVIIGGACLDIKGHLTGELIQGTSNQGRLTISVGGVGRNIAENLARLGVTTTLITAVGADEFGQMLISQTEEAGVNTDAVLIVEDEPTAAYLALLDAKGLLVTALDDSHSSRALTAEYLRENETLIASADVVFIDANLTRSASTTVLDICTRNAIPICLEPVAFGLASRFKERLDGLYLVTPNEREAEALTGIEVVTPQTATQAAKELVRLGVEVAVVTLAGQGIVYATSQTHGHISTVATDIVDATGAGDALAAAVLFGLMNDLPVDEAVRLGASAAALTLASADTVRRDLSLESLYAQLL